MSVCVFWLVCRGFFLTPLDWSVVAQAQVFSVELQLIFGSPHAEVYSVLTLSPQSCYFYFLLLQKTFYDRLREVSSSSHTLKLYSFIFEIIGVSLILNTLADAFILFINSTLGLSFHSKFQNFYREGRQPTFEICNGRQKAGAKS